MYHPQIHPHTHLIITNCHYSIIVESVKEYNHFEGQFGCISKAVCQRYMRNIPEKYHSMNLIKKKKTQR